MSTKAGSHIRILYTTISTTLGPLGIALAPKGLCAIQLKGEMPTMKRDLERRFPGAELVRDDEGMASAAAVVRGWIDGSEPVAPPPLDLRGTPFQRRVWRAIARIPRGQTISYAELARQAGNPRAIRAAAQACGANPVPLLVPCHRVIAKDGSLGGFGGGLDMKRKLLAREGMDIR
jgi:AraC family transcriptional regulator of adaptative response/methylated-DNA-[protein]-cysteine methyltransferase